MGDVVGVLVVIAALLFAPAANAEMWGRVEFEHDRQSLVPEAHRGGPEAAYTEGGRVPGLAPLDPSGVFSFDLTRSTELLVKGTVAGSRASGTTPAGNQGPPNQWIAVPAYAGATSQGQPIVARCVRSEVTNPNYNDTFWLDARALKTKRGRLALHSPYDTTVLSDGFSESQTERCDSGKVRFTARRDVF